MSFLPWFSFEKKKESRSNYEKVVKGCEWDLGWCDKGGESVRESNGGERHEKGAGKRQKGSNCERFVYKALMCIEGQSRKLGFWAKGVNDHLCEQAQTPYTPPPTTHSYPHRLHA